MNQLIEPFLLALGVCDGLPHHGDQQAIRSVLSLQPTIDFVATRKTSAIRYLPPLA
jgi:hypothetical protein